MSFRGLWMALALAVLAAAALPGVAWGAVTLDVTPAPAYAVTGDNPTITATVTNTGASPETDFSVLFSPQDDGVTAKPAGSVGCVDFIVLVCPITSLDPGQSVAVRVSYGSLKLGTATLWVNVNTSPSPPPPQFVWTTVVTSPAKLGFTLAAQQPSFTAGNTTSLTATATNTGAGPAYDATMRLSLPFGLSPESLPPDCTAAGLVLTCPLGDLASQTSTTRTIPLRPPDIGTYTVLGTASWARPPTAPADVAINVLAPNEPDTGSSGLPIDPNSLTPATPETVTLERITRGLPGRNRCVRDWVLDVLLRSPGGVDPKTAVIRLGKKVVKRLKGARATAPFTIRVPRSGRFVVRVTATLTDGRILMASRTYRVCRRR